MEYIWFGLVGFYSISTIVGHLMPNPFYTYKKMIAKHILKMTILNKRKLVFLLSQISKLATIVEGDPKTPFSIATTPRCRRGYYTISWVASLYTCSSPYSAECLARRHQVPFLSLWYDSTLDWTLVSRILGEHSTNYANKFQTLQFTHLFKSIFWFTQLNVKNSTISNNSV